MINNYREMRPYVQDGLYNPQNEHENCGIGAVVKIDGQKTRRVVEDALRIVETLEHRAGNDAEGKTGDGVGILLQISHEFFSKVMNGLGDEGTYGIAMLFMPQGQSQAKAAQDVFEQVCADEGLPFIGWREVPVNPDVLGARARESMPRIMQAFVGIPEGVNKGIDFDRKLYTARMIYEKRNEDTYVCSCSSRTIVYKGMFLVNELRTFYKDLSGPDYVSAIGIVHSRFSTNTNPSWQRSHPYRLIVHNGEINTITGNMNKMLSREGIFHTRHLEERLNDIYPMLDVNGSDSARLDNTLEFMMMSGMPLPLAVMVTVPEPWQHIDTMSRARRAFCQYYATMMEPWDGPAAVLFTDGEVFGATLDRNGLRPSRYYVTKDGRLILASEVGVLDIPDENILRKSRLSPGHMLLVDTREGRIISDEECKNRYAG